MQNPAKGNSLFASKSNITNVQHGSIHTHRILPPPCIVVAKYSVCVCDSNLVLPKLTVDEQREGWLTWSSTKLLPAIFCIPYSIFKYSKNHKYKLTMDEQRDPWLTWSSTKLLPAIFCIPYSIYTNIVRITNTN